jgi:alkylation response protein AidB-like acyl-CoA dehydrogenase
MNLHLSEDQTLLTDTVEKLFRNECTPERLRAAEPLGFDPVLWSGVVEMGLPLMRVPIDRDGGGMSLFEAVLIADLAGRFLASVPLIETIVAGRLLALAGGGAATDALARLGAGETLPTLALHPADAQPVQTVPAGAVADGVLCLSGDSLYLVGAEARGEPASGHAMPLARWSFATLPAPLASGPAVVAAYQAAVEEWKLLAAAVQGGLARGALDQAAAYARDRHAFGQPIGSFQGLAHPLADAITDIDGGALAVWLVLDGLAKGHKDAAAHLSLVRWWMNRAAPAAIVKAMRAFGGYGMTMDYDVQFFYRRSRALALTAGDPDHDLALGADRLFGRAAPTALPDTGEIGIDFSYGAAAEQAAEEARAFFEANLTDELRAFARTTLDGYHPAFHKKMAEAGILFPDWPKELGGAARSAFESVAIRDVLSDYGWAFAFSQVADMVAKMVMMFSPPEVQAEVLPGIAKGDIVCALGYTEPSCGSDVFAAKTKAVRDGDDWIIDGQKMFTSQGHMAGYVLLLARTNPDGPKHAGLTLFLVPTRQDGYEVHEVQTISQERTNITYYSGVRVPDRYRIGAVNGGVKALAAALAMEQGGNAYFAHVFQQMLRHAVDWASDATDTPEAPIDSAEVRRRLARAKAHVLVTEALTHRALWAAEAKCARKAYGPMSKLFATESAIVCGADLVALAAPDSLFADNPTLSFVELESRRAIPSSVYGGASEILRSMIAEDALGLPKTR